MASSGIDSPSLLLTKVVRALRQSSFFSVPSREIAQNGGAEIARPDIARLDKAAPDQTAR